MLDVLLDEVLWFPMAIAAALIAVIALTTRQWNLKIPKRTKVACSLHLFYGFAIGIMGIGHLLAVTSKSILGALLPNTNLWFVIPLGLALVIPAWWLVATVGGLTRDEKSARHKAIGLNAWLGLVLLVSAGPLAVPAAVNVILLTSKRPA